MSNDAPPRRSGRRGVPTSDAPITVDVKGSPFDPSIDVPIEVVPG